MYFTSVSTSLMYPQNIAVLKYLLPAMTPVISSINIITAAPSQPRIIKIETQCKR